MSRISTGQIIEILDDGNVVCFRKHGEREGLFVAQVLNEQTGAIVDSEAGPDMGELVNELHTRL